MPDPISLPRALIFGSAIGAVTGPCRAAGYYLETDYMKSLETETKAEKQARLEKEKQARLKVTAHIIEDLEQQLSEPLPTKERKN